MMSAPDIATAHGLTMIICVWHETQLVPARLYGEANYKGGYELRACDNPTRVVEEIKRNGGDAMVYYFASGGGSGLNCLRNG